MNTQYPGLLGLANIILLIASTILMYLGASLTNFYLLDKLDFVSIYFKVVPSIMICLGVGSFITALYGCFVAVRQSRWQLILYATLMVVLFITQLAGIFAAMELRSVVYKGEFTGIDVLSDLKDYKKSPSTRAKWDSLHREFHCCGGLNFNNGYKIWRNADIGMEDNSVPDSCCQRQSAGCGRNVFTQQDITLTQQIHTHGCVTMMEEKLKNQVVPILLGYAGVGTCLALLQLLAIVFACAYSAAISRKQNRQDDGRSTYDAGSQWGNSGFGQDNMSAVFVHENSLDKKKRFLPSPTEMDEREV